jgi:uncharacterized protein (TIGR02246 family)
MPGGKERKLMSDNEERNLATAASLCRAWNDHDPDAFAAHFAEDGIWLLARGAPPDGFTVKGKSAIRDMYRHYCDTIPDIHCEVRCHWANGADRACSEWHITGTTANGEKLDWLGLDLWQFDGDGKVVRCDAYYKSPGNLSGEDDD